jgi:hypothetical protein
LLHFAPRHAVAIGDDVGGHGGAAFAIAFVQILNDAFALIAAGQIEIDVGPLAAFLERKRSKSNSMPMGSTAVIPSE